MFIQSLKFIFLFLVCLLQVYYAYQIVVITDYGGDVFWHIKIGLDWINEGLSPFIDHYSIFHNGEKYHHLSPYLFQALMGILHNAFGLEGATLVYKAIIVAMASLVFIYFAFKNHMKVELLVLVLTLYFYATLFRMIPRPELLAFVFVVLYIFLIEQLRVHFHRNTIVLLFLLQIFWINYHATAVFGFLIFGAFIFEKLINNYQNKLELKKWILLGILFLLTGFLNPYFSHPLLIALDFSNEWKKLITEHRSFDLGSEYYLTFFVITFLGFIMSALTRRWYLIALIGVFIIQGVSLNKVLTFGYLVASIAFVLSAQSYFFNDDSHSKKIKFLNTYIFTLLLITVLSEYIFLSRIVETKLNFQDLQQNMPVEAMDYLNKTGVQSGKIFNNYNSGGYVLYRMPRGMQNAIDGRTNLLFSPDEMRKVVSSAEDPAVLYYFDKNYNFDFAVSYYNHLYDGSFETTLRSGIFSLEFAGKYSSLFIKAEEKFPAARIAITYPGCIDKEWSQQIKKEITLASETHQESDLLLRILKLFDQYLESDDPALYLYNYDMKSVTTIFELRALAFLAYKMKKVVGAIEFYKAGAWYLLTPRDRIFLIHLVNLSENYDYYGNLVDESLKVLSSNLRYLSLREKEYLYSSLRTMKKKGFSFYDKDHSKLYEKLNKQFANSNDFEFDDNFFNYRCHEKSDLIAKESN